MEAAGSFREGAGHIQGVILAVGAAKRDGWAADEEKTMERLKYSGLQYASLYHVCQGAGIPPQGEDWLPWEEEGPLGKVLEEAVARWSLPRNTVAVVLGESQAERAADLSRDGWPVIILAQSEEPGASEDETARAGSASHAEATLAHMGELPAAIACINKQRAGPGGELVVVAYTMKWSREWSLLERLALPWVPRPPGLSFFPVDLSRPLERQLDAADALLHKATDEMVDLGKPGASVTDRFGFSPGFEALLRYVGENPGLCMIDPIEKIGPMLDRHLMQAALTGLSQVAPPGTRVAVRAPCSAEVSSFEAAEVDRAMQRSGVTLPAIVKPQVACGAAESHTMAVVLHREGFVDLKVPTPAVIQEYVDHGSLQHKVYAVGPRVFVSQRRSTPNALSLALQSQSATSNGPAAIIFDSLRSLPTSFQGEEGAPVSNQPVAKQVTHGTTPLDMRLVEAAAEWLRGALGLTIIGFDIVIQEGSGDHVVVDINYFPSFKDVANETALPAFWNALHGTYSVHKTRLASAES